MFGVSSLWLKQHDAIKAVLSDSASDEKLLVVHRTEGGGGKSLILQMTAISLGTITVVVIPLLALAANQMARIARVDCTRMAVTAIHLDEISNEELHLIVIPKLNELSDDTTE